MISVDKLRADILVHILHASSEIIQSKYPGTRHFLAARHLQDKRPCCREKIRHSFRFSLLLPIPPTIKVLTPQ